MLKAMFFIPLDLGLKVDFDKVKRNKLISASLEPLNSLEQSIFRNSVIKLVKDSYTYFIDTNGVGIVSYTDTNPGIKLNIENCTDILIEKKSLIAKMMSGNHYITKLTEDIQLELLKMSNSKTRPTIFKNVLYVDSLYSFKQNYYGSNDQAEIQKCLCAMFEASLINLDNFYHQDKNNSIDKDRIIDIISNLDIKDYADLLTTANDSPGLTVFSSWEGGVIFDKDLSENETFFVLYAYLEYSWAIASYVDIWASNQIKQKARLTAIEKVEVDFVSLLDELDEVIDYSVPIRLQLIYKRIVNLSMLTAQIEQAKNSIFKLKQYQIYLRDASSKKANTIIQILLFLLALTQAVPLFFSTPVMKVDSNFISLAIIAIIALFLYLIRKK